MPPVSSCHNLISKLRAGCERHGSATDQNAGDAFTRTRREHSQPTPYDVILVAAGSRMVPKALTDQLADGGRLLIPVGESRRMQLRRITRSGAELRTESADPCLFVPLLPGVEEEPPPT